MVRGRRITNRTNKKRTAAARHAAIPKIPSGFSKLAYTLTYIDFLRQRHQKNQTVERVVVEKEWKKLIKGKWMVWATDLPEPERQSALDSALAQINSTEVESYWTNHKSRSTNSKRHAATAFRVLQCYKLDFTALASTYHYAIFLRDLDRQNGRIIERERAETAWKDLVRGKWHAWKSDLSPDEKLEKLELALAQIDGPKDKGKEGIERYWNSKINSDYEPEDHLVEMLERVHVHSRVGRKRKRKSHHKARKMAGGEKIQNTKDGGIDVRSEEASEEVETENLLAFDFNNLSMSMAPLRPTS